MDNIINFPVRASEPTVLEFEIGLGSVEEARRTLEGLQATAAVGLKIVESAESERKILVRLQNLFEAFTKLLECDREVEAVRESTLQTAAPTEGANRRSRWFDLGDPPSAT
jgi:hypothetical protein